MSRITPLIRGESCSTCRVMPEASEQRSWRDNTRTTPVVVHLSDDEVGMLDELAIRIWADDPHNPDEGVIGQPGAGRARALRELVQAQLAAAHGAARAKRRAWRPPAALEAMAEFWKLEVCWRRSGGDPCRPPQPPWQRVRR